MRVAVNKNGKIAILDWETKILHIGNVCIEQNSFKIDKVILSTNYLAMVFSRREIYGSQILMEQNLVRRVDKPNT